MEKIFKKTISLFVLTLIFLFFTIFSQTSNKVIYYYSEVCPECKQVNDFLKTYQVEKKFSFEKKEVSFNKKNATELAQKAKKCAIESKELPVPFVWDGKNCIVGDKAVIKFFKQKAGL